MSVDIAKLRKRYTPATVPICPVCGQKRQQEEYTIDGRGGWACQSDPNRIILIPHKCADPDVLALCDELETARRRLQEARGLLFEREWIFLPGDGLVCLVCGELKSQGHAPDCRLATWLGEP